jgi:apolipoprotein N-acyltransferase
MSKRAPLIAAVAATALVCHVCSYMEPRWFALEWVAFVPWLLVLDRATTLRAALSSGWLMSVAFVVAVFSWFAPAIASYAGVSAGLAYVITLVCAPLLQPQFLAFAGVRHIARRAHGSRIGAVAAASAYVGAEWLCPKLFADTLGHGFYASVVMRQAADLAGAHGLTFAILLANECFAATMRRWRSEARVLSSVVPTAAAVLIAATLAAYGALRHRQLEGEGNVGTPLRATLVQGDIAQYERMRKEIGAYETVRLILDRYFAMSRAALAQSSSDVLLWPETMYPTTFGKPKSPDGAAFDDEIASFAREAGVPLVFGSYDREGDREYNAAMFLDAGEDGTRRLDVYRKSFLFPLTERVPVWLDFAFVRRLMPWLGSWNPGDGARVEELLLRDGRTVRAAPLICLDAVAPGLAIEAVRAGAEVLFTLSNDSWFSVGNGPLLHLVVSAFRSLETRRPQLRVTNTGISSAITPTGSMIATAGVHEQAALTVAVVPVADRWTLMLAWGDWFGPTALVAAIALLLAAMVRSR